MSEAKFEEIAQLLAEREHPVAFLATVDVQGFPQVRPLTLMSHGKDFYLATSTSSRKALQLTRDDRVEFVSLLPKEGNTGYLRVMGNAKRVVDPALAKKVTEACGYPVKKYWQGVEDDDFFLIRVEPQRVEYMKPGEFEAIEVTRDYVE
ncbi:MAG: pyridoxamine 5'-phosphate oxidase family protein [bacterium]